MSAQDHNTWDFPGSTLAVGTLFAIGRNYSAHAAEMNAAVDAEPIVFLKPPTAYRPTGSIIHLPTWSATVHHEVEVVVVIGQSVSRISESEAWDVVAGIGIGLDLTARDVQAKAKSEGNPWARSKGWPGSAPVSPLVPVAHAGKGPWQLSLLVNTEVRQRATTDLMEHPIPRLISEVAKVFTLRPGDAIFTGTPEGVGPVVAGDVAVARLDSLTELTVRFA